MLDTKYSSKISFIHGNGFSPDSYKTLIENLEKKFIIKPFLLRSIWDNISNYKKLDSWNVFYDDFQNYIESNFKRPIIGIGHSIGGNIVLSTALRKQNLFEKIILLDPTLFIPSIVIFWKIANLFNLTQYIHPFSLNTKNKKMKYQKYEDMFKSYRSKAIFKKVNDKNLNYYIKSITKEKNNQIEITYPKMWEYQIYNKGLLKDNFIWRNILNLSVPCLIIRAESSNAFLDSAAKKLVKLNPTIKIITIPKSTHLFPLEYPKLTFNAIETFLSN